MSVNSPQVTTGNSTTHAAPCSQTQTKRQFACLYTKQKTQKHRIWHDGRLVVTGTRASLYDANPVPGSSGGPLDECDLSSDHKRRIVEAHETQLETEKFLVQLEGPWDGAALTLRPTGTENAPGRNDRSHTFKNKKISRMEKILNSKFQKPKLYVPPNPDSRPTRAVALLGKRRRPLQPGELERIRYGKGADSSTTGLPAGSGALAQQRTATNHHCSWSFSNSQPTAHAQPRVSASSSPHTTQQARGAKSDGADFRHDAATQPIASELPPPPYKRQPSSDGVDHPLPQNPTPSTREVLTQPRFQLRPNAGNCMVHEQDAAATGPCQDTNSAVPVPPTTAGHSLVELGGTTSADQTSLSQKHAFVSNEFDANNFYGFDEELGDESPGLPSESGGSHGAAYGHTIGTFHDSSPPNGIFEAAPRSGDVSGSQILALFGATPNHATDAGPGNAPSALVGCRVNGDNSKNIKFVLPLANSDSSSSAGDSGEE